LDVLVVPVTVEVTIPTTSPTAYPDPGVSIVAVDTFPLESAVNTNFNPDPFPVTLNVSTVEIPTG